MTNNKHIEEHHSDTKLPLDIIFINLENISKLNIGDKLIHDDKHITVDTSYLQSITRTYYGQSRFTNLDFIKKILNDSYKHLNELKEKKDDASGILWIKLISKLKQSITGLHKLKQTYNGDEKFMEQIDIIIKNICIKT
jgi:hypothetical protein